MKEYFYTITESMLDLGLKGTELNLFAIIYGYSQRGDGVCYVSRPELAKRCGVASIRTIDATIRSLVNKGLILKETYKKGELQLTGYKYCYPRANSAHPPVQNLHPTPVQKLHAPRANSAPMENKVNNTSVFIPPTPPEVADYVRKFGMADPDGFAIYYVEQMTNNGWTYGKKGTPVKNWKNNVQQWLKYHKNEDFSFLKPSSTPTQKPAPSALNPDTYHKIFE